MWIGCADVGKGVALVQTVCGLGIAIGIAIGYCYGVNCMWIGYWR